MTIGHPRPTQKFLTVERSVVEGSCPRCGAAELQAYPVLSEGGWFDVVKCAACLASIERKPGPKLGPVQLLSDHI